ncbi:reticulocyte-binding protein 2 homolog a-like isoform X2 [Mizuhopecten yessoensis]|uniref:Mitochondria-eating protein n=2 Tax=Mizuhopecten yessoensis TaxID=6573 RepID=A0A210R1W2_MIZYE|nr:reticulocyte-binding protein 2 homolog a-like isoform X2 [Mizuhopecten yessoensis]XP_021379621.1 reticulocyte-binding protein 2 homolog a-like isoform X2 [Mizuhopecten yessoensis]OWF54875.1 hypothetical protein KP79_PYT12494 [Mizuhopecten yessoensis]
MSSQEKQKHEEPLAKDLDNKDNGQSSTSNPDKTESNTEQKNEDLGSGNGIAQSTDAQHEIPASNNGTTRSEQCNTQNNTDLLAEVQKIHFLICEQKGSQTDDSILLIQESQRVFSEMLDKIEKSVEMPAQFTGDTEKKHRKSEKSAQKNNEAAAKTTRIKTLLCYLDQKRGEMTKLREEVEKTQSELNKFEQVHAERTSWYKGLQEDIQKQHQPTIDIPEVLSEEEKRGFKMFKTVLEKKTEKVEKLEKEMKELDQTQEQRLKTKAKEMDKLREREAEKVEKLKKEKKSLEQRGEQNLKSMEKEMDMLRQRLSKMAGAKLTEGNPSFTDLNDPNRPLKLAERYTELNDNEWTDAYEILTGDRGIKRKDAIIILRDIVTDCYNECVRLAEEQWRSLARILTQTRTDTADETLKEIGFRQTEFKDLKNLRKMAATKASDKITEKVKETLLERLEDKQKMQQLNLFIEAGIRLTWDMAVHDPPVYMYWDLKQGDPPNDKFKVYTKSGNKVRYVVWPSLLLHKDGPLLVKGVYQLFT